MDITQKITRDINQFKNIPSSQAPNTSATAAAATTDSSSGWSISSIFTPYTIGIVIAIILIFVAWFAWDWYKTHKKDKKETNTTTSDTTTTSTPIGGDTTKPTDGQSTPVGGDTVKPSHLPPDQSIPPVVTTMSPLAYAKYQKDQRALETALGPSNVGGSGGTPMPDDSADGAGKAGWCYIGEDQGYGVCASVQPTDKCMSGKVFPTESECRKIN